MNTFQQVIILSAESTNNSNEKNRQLTENLASCLDDCNLSYNRAEGFYKGIPEASFVVLPKNQVEIDTVKDFAFKNFSQESVLYQDANGLAHLVFSNGHEELLGKLRQVNGKFTEQLDNYTVLNGKVYTTEDL